LSEYVHVPEPANDAYGDRGTRDLSRFDHSRSYRQCLVQPTAPGGAQSCQCQSFTTYFEAHSARAEEAAGSAELRKQLLIRSLELTAEHPLFGVSPGEFIDAEAAETGEEGRRGMWHYSHNSYTELSSKTGIAGLVLFVIAFFGAYRGLSPIRNKYPDLRVRRAALFTQMALFMTAVGAFFLSIAYGGIVIVVIAISATLQATVANKARQARLQPSENPR